jgi:aerobic carbon-monoxide dehydrogenase medium subunit
MFPSSFDYTLAATLDEALEVLAQRGDEAKVLAGGQSLIPLMKLRFAAPSLIVDVNRIEGLDSIDETDDELRIGALVRHSHLESLELLKSRYSAMADAAPLIADPIIRNLGTMGGSLAHADPAGDWGSVMLAAGASVSVASSTGTRQIPVKDLLLRAFTTSMEPTEFLTEIRIPRPRGRSGGAYLKMERKVGDFATVGVAVQLEMGNGTISRAGIGLTAVGSKNIEPTEAESALTGATPSPEAFEEAARLASEAAQPITDVRGSADYKRAVVRTLVRRGLEIANKRASAA